MKMMEEGEQKRIENFVKSLIKWKVLGERLRDLMIGMGWGFGCVAFVIAFHGVLIGYKHIIDVYVESFQRGDGLPFVLITCMIGLLFLFPVTTILRWIISRVYVNRKRWSEPLRLDTRG